MKIRVGSRESKLAVVQSQIIISKIKNQHPDAEIELLTMKTTGDILQNEALDKVGGKGLFVKELDSALMQRKVDICVHSYKDVPMQTPKELPIVAVSEREDERDVLILPLGKTQIDYAKPIGCSSKRRELQLKNIYSEAKIAKIRGNVQTRLEKLDRGEYSAIVLALAGIKRLGLESRVSRIFSVEEILPAACQGILAVQAREDFDESIAKELCHEKTMIIANAERAFVRKLDGGCSSPTAAHAVFCGEKIKITGLYVDENGNVIKGKKIGEAEFAEELGEQLAEEMKCGTQGR